jgi:hypothetical protein
MDGRRCECSVSALFHDGDEPYFDFLLLVVVHDEGEASAGHLQLHLERRYTGWIEAVPTAELVSQDGSIADIAVEWPGPGAGRRGRRFHVDLANGSIRECISSPGEKQPPPPKVVPILRARRLPYSTRPTVEDPIPLRAYQAPIPERDRYVIADAEIYADIRIGDLGLTALRKARYIILHAGEAFSDVALRELAVTRAVRVIVDYGEPEGLALLAEAVALFGHLRNVRVEVSRVIGRMGDESHLEMLLGSLAQDAECPLDHLAALAELVDRCPERSGAMVETVRRVLGAGPLATHAAAVVRYSAYRPYSKERSPFLTPRLFDRSFEDATAEIQRRIGLLEAQVANDAAALRREVAAHVRSMASGVPNELGSAGISIQMPSRGVTMMLRCGEFGQTEVDRAVAECVSVALADLATLRRGLSALQGAEILSDSQVKELSEVIDQNGFWRYVRSV